MRNEEVQESIRELKHLFSSGAIRKQLAAFLEGFYEIIPKRLISIFTEQELELLISGLPTIDIDDLKANTEYHKYQSSSIQVCTQGQHEMNLFIIVLWLMSSPQHIILKFSLIFDQNVIYCCHTAKKRIITNRVPQGWRIFAGQPGI